MTAAALMYFSDRATICADTRVYDDLGETVGYAAKVYALPSMRAMFFGRGKLSITHVVVSKLLLSPQLHTFDDAAAAFSDIYREVTDAFCEQFDFDRTAQPLHECCFAGWSESEQRVRLGFASSLGNFALHFQESYGGPFAWPRVPASCIPAPKSTDGPDDRLRDTLLGIDRWCVENPTETGGTRLGGSMTLADLTENGISCRDIGAFEPTKSQDGKRTAAARKRGRR